MSNGQNVQKGSALWISLLLLSLIALEILSQLQQIVRYQQAFQAARLYQQERSHLEKMLYTIARALPGHHQQCTQQKPEAPDVIAQSLHSEQACMVTLHDTVYHYWIEDIGIMPCLQTMIQENRYSTHHWRLSAYSTKIPHVILQIQAAQASKLETCTPARNIQYIRSGVQSWRII